jgi:hypothetical protein
MLLFRMLAHGPMASQQVHLCVFIEVQCARLWIRAVQCRSTVYNHIGASIVVNMAYIVCQMLVPKRSPKVQSS